MDAMIQPKTSPRGEISSCRSLGQRPFIGDDVWFNAWRPAFVVPAKPPEDALRFTNELKPNEPTINTLGATCTHPSGPQKILLPHTLEILRCHQELVSLRIWNVQTVARFSSSSLFLLSINFFYRIKVQLHTTTMVNVGIWAHNYQKNWFKHNSCSWRVECDLNDHPSYLCNWWNGNEQYMDYNGKVV